MSGYRYEREGYTIDSLTPMSEANLDGVVAMLKARAARWSEPRQRRLNPAWNAEDVVERFGGPAFEPVTSTSTDRQA